MFKKLFFKETMKNSRKLYNELGIQLVLFLILFNAANEYVFVPVISKLWGLVLLTTPDGFVSNANILNTLIHSPWIVPIGIVFIIIYALIALWQTIAIIIGIGFIHEGKRINLLDLIKLSFLKLKEQIKAKNWPILFYSLIIIPLANIYQTNEIIGAFALPEFIQDFINNNFVLSIIFILLILFIIYIALKWFFILPAFIFKGKDFKEARKESLILTKNKYIKNGFNIGIYSIIELIRLSIIPSIIILLPCLICYINTSDLQFANSLYNIIGLQIGSEAVQTITSTLVEISTMCFLVEIYFERLNEYEIKEEIELQSIRQEEKKKISINKLHLIFSIVFSIIISGSYFISLHAAQNDSSFILSIFGKTEIIAHKGYSSKAPENTIAAFDLANDCEDVSYIEIDVRSTSDGIPVVIHNATITEATGVDKSIYDCTYEEIKDLPATYGMSEYSDARIPTLEEVISRYADKKPLLIEIKGYKEDPDLPRKIVELLKKYNCEYKCLIHSGEYESLKAVKEIDPDIKCGLILAMVTGNYYDLEYADFYSIEHTFVNTSTINLLHKRGKQVYAWTVNYSESIEELRLSGVDGIITDYPEDVSEYLKDTNNLIKDVLTSNIKILTDSQDLKQGVDNFENGEY